MRAVAATRTGAARASRRRTPAGPLPGSAMPTDRKGANEICGNRTELRARGAEPTLHKLPESRHDGTRCCMLTGLPSQIT